ncbi:hypothetical protein JCGZ_13056 [Jatropha curcas]|uniref:Protein kinase domain-containing protein n=1 Tax=Jatropha curcas TaxID=180498 RepID=A0A067KL73_JATCU|nr:receptor-like protein kinase FERONIA [Jatropha curcas]KDP33025.1 hypothetical protein JCGZ_13056 [Jatropha curcas]
MIFASLYLSFFLNYLSIYLAASYSPPSYVPDLNCIPLACGLTSNTTSMDGRIWLADANSKFFPSEQGINNASIAVESPKNLDTSAPYTAARISRSQFTYMFPLSVGTLFIRLHFYPAPYLDFNTSKAYFSVKTDSHTLLSNFSSKVVGFGQFFREFWLVIEDEEILNLTFAPSPGMEDAFAFINGIELMSIPTYLYDTPAGNPRLKFVGQNNPLDLVNKAVLEFRFRINVGGRYISPPEDTKLCRVWENDDEYLTIAKPSAIIVNASTVPLRYSIYTRFAAPDLVYKTYRSMGTDKYANENYNLTWEFQVDSGFTYFVRLHFCEFQPTITEDGNRVFQIYIAGQLAESEADIIYWSGGNRIPVFQDYAVTTVTRGNEKVQNLSIALHPVTNLTVYSDAILNGIEIFKMIGPEIHTTSAWKSRKPKKKTITKIAVVGATILTFIVLPLSFLLIVGVRRRLTDKNSGNMSPWGPNCAEIDGPSLPYNHNLCHHFSAIEIREATNNFDKSFIIGVGGFGNVYKGTINNGTKTVAIKRLSPGSEQGANEFKTEIEMLSQLRHHHLVSLIGYCNQDNEMILVYDYMAHGTLRDHLYNTTNPPLPWNQRLEVCLGAARGLHYLHCLHSGTKNAIIHRDVKSTNILIDENWVAKVSDFGLSKMRTANNSSKSHITTVVKGSYGYLDPEYYRRKQLTEKSDVYSFGVVLFEALCARPAVDQTVEDDDYNEQVSLAVWARKCYCDGTLYQIIDPILVGKIAPECFKIFSEIAVCCLSDERIKRASMSDVVSGLELALKLQRSAEDKFGVDFDLDQISLDVSPNILSLLKIKNSTIDENCSKFSIEESCNSDSVEMTFLGAQERQGDYDDSCS